MREHALSVDPGLKHGVVEWERADGGPWQIKRVTHRLTDPWVRAAPGWDIVVTELQWLHGDDLDQKKRSILQLAFRAGFTAASIPAQRYIAVQPSQWRGNTTAEKAQIQNRIARSLAPDERRLFKTVPSGRHGDILDAIGIGRCALELADTTDKYDWVFGQ